MHPQPWVLLLGALSHTGVGVAYGVSCGYGFQRFTFPGLRGLVASSGQARAERYVTEPISLRDGCHGSAKYARSSSPHQDRKEKKKKRPDAVGALQVLPEIKVPFPLRRDVASPTKEKRSTVSKSRVPSSYRRCSPER